jgi:hypothetical protein
MSSLLDEDVDFTWFSRIIQPNVDACTLRVDRQSRVCVSLNAGDDKQLFGKSMEPSNPKISG